MLLAFAALLSLAMPAARADNGHWLTGYYAIYDSGSMSTSQMDYTLVTHVIFWPVIPNADGTLNTTAFAAASDFDTMAKDIVKRGHAAGIKVLLGVGGAASSGATAGFVGATLNDNRNFFIENITSLVLQYGFDGVDINWEQITSSQDGKFTAFIQGLRAKLNQISPQQLLTMAPEVKGNGGRPDLLAKVYTSLDQINIQTYVMSGAYDGWITWFNSPLNNGGATFPSTNGPLPSITASINDYVSAGVPKNKLAIGINPSAAVWKGGKVSGTGAGVTQPKQSWTVAPSESDDVIHYNRIASTFTGTGYSTPVLDANADEMWQSYTNAANTSQNEFICYDSPDSLAKKGTDLSSSSQAGVGGDLGGVFMFELSEDYAAAASPSLQHPMVVAAHNMKMLLPQLAGAPKATAGNGYAALSWGVANGAAGYNVFFANGTPAASGVIGTSIKIAGLTNGQPYSFYVQPFNAFGQGAVTVPVSVTPAAGGPNQVPAPGFSLPGGTYSYFSNSISVSLNDAVAGASIFYTQDGSTPTTGSTPYTGPIVITPGQIEETINAIAVAPGLSASPVSSATYVVFAASSSILPMPTFSPASGSYATAQSVTINRPVANAQIYYTTDGTTPTHNSAVYSQPVNVSESETIRAILVGNGQDSAVADGVYTINNKAADPVFVPVPGLYPAGSTLSVSLRTDTTGGTIYYTLDGSSPTPASNKYAKPFSIAATTTVRAIVIAHGMNNSNVINAVYTIGGTVPTPVFSPTATQNLSGAESLEITDSLSNAAIYYTVNGSAPTTSSTRYTGPVPFGTTTTFKAIAVATGLTNSAAATITYNFTGRAETPVAVPAHGSYTTAQTVTLSTQDPTGDLAGTPGAVIYYTLDGSTPTNASTQYTGPITISSSKTLKAVAYGAGLTPSPQLTATYTISSHAGTPSFSPSAGTYHAAQSVGILDSTPGAVLYYTLDGSTPTTASPVYTAPLTISSSKTLKAVAYAAGMSSSSISTAAYTVAVQNTGTPTFSPGHGTYTSEQSIVISDATAGASIYYTLDGSTPTLNSAKYTAPFPLSTSKTVKAIAYASGYNPGAVGVASYTISSSQAVAAPTFSPAAGTYYGTQTVTLSAGGSTIYYTTDGSAPTTASPQYTAPLTVSASQTITAIAYGPGGTNPSPMSKAAYVIDPYALWIPDWTNQQVMVRLGSGATPKVVTLDVSLAAGNTGCRANSVAVNAGKVYVACDNDNGDQIAVYDEATIKNAPAGYLGLSPLSMIVGPNGGFQAGTLIALVFDASGNLWASSINDNTVYAIANPGTAPVVYPALVDSPGAPAGMAFDTDGSLWIVSNSGGLVNIQASDLSVGPGGPANVNPKYYVGFDRQPATQFTNSEGVAIFNINGAKTIWVANNAVGASAATQANQYEDPGYTVVPFTLGNPPSNGNPGTLVEGTPLSGQNAPSTNSIQCPGGLFATPAHLWINDEGYGDQYATPSCGSVKYQPGQITPDQGGNVGGVLSFTAAQIVGTPNLVSSSQALANVTSRPGFGGIFVEGDN